MTDVKEKGSEDSAPGRRPGQLELRKTVETRQVRQSFSHGRSKAVVVEVRGTRTFKRGESGRMAEVRAPQTEAQRIEAKAATTTQRESRSSKRGPAVLRTLTDDEKEARARALESARRADREAHRREAAEAAKAAALAAEDAAKHAAEEAEKRRAAEEAAAEAPVEAPAEPAPEVAEAVPAKAPEAKKPAAPAKPGTPPGRLGLEASEELQRRRARETRRPPSRRNEPRRREGKLTITQALTQEDRVRSLASYRRARERERERERRAMARTGEPAKVVREVVIPETITVQELANRMAVRGAEVVKALMKMGTMATITQAIDADTAEVLVTEFGHLAKRVSAADVEIGLRSEEDAAETLEPRPPVVTVMGHVDHGKTSLLDALRRTDVVAAEAGGITQHIGAYQVTLDSGAKITFIDTPGHEAFTAMRKRGASVTDIVVLVVAADDGVKPQTVEAIAHARAAGVPIVLAINKIDRPEADPERVRNELLQHEVVVESLGGDVLSVEVSATERINLDKLAEAILLQAELLEIKANPNRPAEGVVIEAKLERGRGPVATVLVRRGTLRIGDIIVAGTEWGRVRALVDSHGRPLRAAGPSTPAEVLGLSGVPAAGDDVVTVENDRRAREVTAYRHERLREVQAVTGARGTLEQMLDEIKTGQAAELPVVIKADVQGSVEALAASLERLATEEVGVRLLHAGVGGINESDVTLAEASNALIIGFNVRANAQAREHAKRAGVDVRYYSVIYNVIDDVKAMLSGLLAPAIRERIVGNAQVLEVFDVSKIGRVAGCRVTDGVIRRGAGVRLLRDDTVVYQGRLATLKRFKDDVREVHEGQECGMSFDNYQDIRIGDVIEAFEVEEVARTL